MPPEKKEVRLDPAFQARLLEQMREEQAAAIRARELRNWVLVPCALFSLVVGIVLMFSSSLMVATMANIVTSGLGLALWRTNRERIRDVFGR
jgi:hypothetical protein